MILITGANGHYGTAVANFLIQKGMQPGNIVAMVRDVNKGAELQKKGIAIRQGDYDNYTSLVKAFTGIETVLLISGSDIPKRTKQHENAVNAAKDAKVKNIIYTSFERKNETESSPIAAIAASHMATEGFIKSSGLAYSILRNNLYMDFIPFFLGEKVIETGVYYPAADGHAAPATRTDMAEATANLILSGKFQNKEYYFSNTESYSMQDIANALSEIAGKTVSYISPSQEEFKNTLIKMGVPQEHVAVTAGFAEAYKTSELNPGKSDLETFLGRKPTTVPEFLRSVYGGK